MSAFVASLAVALTMVSALADTLATVVTGR
jgi:hypothetical protein